MDQNPENNEISFLDLLVVIAKNWKLLVAGPLIAGIVSLGLSFALPRTYTSQSILGIPSANQNQQIYGTLNATPTPAQAAVMIISPIVLDPVIDALKLYEGEGITDARTQLAKKLKVTVGKDTLLRLEVEGSSPIEAQNIANAIIDSWLKSTTPGEQEQADLAKRLASAQKSLDAVNRLLDRLTSEGSSSLNQPLTRGEAGASLVAVGELQNRYLKDVLALPRIIKGLSRDVVLQPPTLPSDPSGPKKGLIVLLASLLTEFALLCFIFIRATWQNSSLNPEIARKQAELHASFVR